VSANVFVSLFVLCASCGERIGVAVPTGRSSPSKLHDPFQAKCPHCGETSSYRKADVYIGAH